MTHLMKLPLVPEGEEIPLGFSRSEWKHNGEPVSIVRIHSPALMNRAVITAPLSLGLTPEDFTYQAFINISLFNRRTTRTNDPR